MNNGAVYDPKAKAHRRKRKDSYAWADIIGSINGRFLAIEVKNVCTGDKPSPDQEEFRLLVQTDGGIHIWGRSLDQVKLELYYHAPDTFPMPAELC